jgi:Flp pilus assembly protein TadD
MFETFESGSYGGWDEAEEKAFMAYEMYETGQMNLALGQLAEAIEINPTNSAWYFNKGLTLDTLERFEEAIEAYEQALKLKGDDPEILNCLAVDYTRIGQYDLAISTFEYIQQLDATFEPCYCNRIITYAEMDLHDKAEHMFYLAQQINPDCAICFYNIGNSLFSRGRFKRAIWCWQKTGQLEPAHPQINYRLAQAYWADGNNQLAKAHFLSELRTNPGDVDVILDFGIFLLECGNVDGAKEKFNRTLELDPDYAAAMFYLGEIALGRHDESAATHLFNKALKRDSQMAGPRYRLAQLALAADNTDEACRYLHAECDLEPQDPQVLLSIGSMFLTLDQLDYAANCLLKVVDQDRTNHEAFGQLGVALGKRGEYEGALQFLEHAVKLQGQDPHILADVAFIYYKTGRFIQAGETIATACTLSGHDPDIVRLASRIRLAAIGRNFSFNLRSNRLIQNAQLFFACLKCRLRYLLTRITHR